MNETTDATCVTIVMQRRASPYGNEASVACKVSPLSRSILPTKCLHKAQSRYTSILTSLPSNLPPWICSNGLYSSKFYSSFLFAICYFFVKRSFSTSKNLNLFYVNLSNKNKFFRYNFYLTYYVLFIMIK